MIVYTDQYAIVHNDMSSPISLGILMFYDINTTVPKNVTDTDGNNLGHIITLNEYGRPSTQILCDGDYSVAIYEYIGPEFDTNDLTNFKLIRTDDIYDPTVHIINKIGGETTLNTIDELKEFNNPVNGTTVQVNGYYEAGDCLPRYYFFDEHSTASDDNGSVIKPYNITGEGRWILVTPDRVDVRYFGVFPFKEGHEATFYSSRLQAATNYARTYSRPVYFAKHYPSAVNYYGLDGTTITGNIIIDNATRFYSKGGTTSHITQNYGTIVANPNESIFSGDGKYEVKGVDFYTKWSTSNVSFKNYNKVYYNANYTYSNFANVVIDVLSDVNEGYTFEGCTLNFLNNSHLSSNDVYTFKHMTVSDAWWSNAIVDINNITLYECVVNRLNFSNSYNYFKFALENGDGILDFYNTTMLLTENNIQTIKYDILIKNAIMTIAIDTSNTVSFQDSTISLYGSSKFGTLNLNNTNVNTSEQIIIECQHFNVNKSIVNMNVNASVDATCESSNVRNLESYLINMTNCNVFGVITSKPHWVNGLYVVEGAFINNTFMYTGSHAVWYNEPTDVGIRVYINWTGNKFLGTKSIVVPKITDVWHFDSLESNHLYVWKGNTGNCPQEVQYNVELGCGKWYKQVYTIPDPSGAATDLQMCHIYFPKMGGMRWGYEKERIFTSYDLQAFTTPAEHHYLAVRGNMWNGNESVKGESVSLFNNIVASIIVSSTVENFYQLCPIWDNFVPCGCLFEMEANLPIALSTPVASTVADSGFDGIKYRNWWHRYMLSKKEDIEA